MNQNKSRTEWDKLYFPNQKEKLIRLGVELLEEIVTISKNNKLSDPILISEKINHYDGCGFIDFPVYDQLFLTNEGILTKYYTTEIKKTFFNIIDISKDVQKELIIDPLLYPHIVEEYKIGLSELINLRNDLEF